MAYSYDRTDEALKSAASADSKVYRFPEGTMTLREWVERHAVKLLTGKQPKLRYDRVKYNRMDGREQAQYEKDTSEPTVPYYEAWTEKGTGQDIPKSIFDAYRGKIRVEQRDRTRKP